jgi:type I restriction enzyme S subunit
LSNRRYLHNQRLGKVIIQKPELLDKHFLYYLLRTDIYRHEILASATGTTVKHTAPERIKRFKFNRPPLPEQRAIAAMLGALDDNIECLRVMNATLEAIAEALFRSWFVDFDPVYERAEALQVLAGLPRASEVAALFPDELEESALGMVPKGWRVGKFIDMLQIISGGTPKTSVSDYWNGDIPWFSVVDTPKPGEVFVVDTEKKITKAGLENCSARLLQPLTTIISVRGTVGNVALVGVPMAMNQSCYALRASTGHGNVFLYFATREVTQSLKDRSHGSVFDTITRATFESLDVIVPPSKTTRAFDDLVQPIVDLIKRNIYEARTLAGLRNELLPQLLSGRVRVPVEEVATP